MPKAHDQHTLRKINTRSLNLSLMLGLIFLLPNTYAAVSTNSLALWANCFLSIGYVLASSVSVLAYKQKHHDRLEYTMNLAIAAFLLVIISIIWINIYIRIYQGFTYGSISFALGLFSLYILINSYMFFRTYYYGKVEKSTIMLTQANIYLVKLSLNFTVLGSLLLTHFFYRYPWAKYFDLLCSLLLSIFILIKAIELYNSTKKIHFL